MFAKALNILRSPTVNFASTIRLFSQAASKAVNPSIVEKNIGQNVVGKASEDGKIILLTKKHLKQSPLKMKFLVRLVRGSWVPDAVAQMKFSPKHRAEDIARILNRGIALARVRYNAIPEELFVKEVMVTKGMIRRGVRIMGRGRAGMAAKRTAHVRMKIEVADFEKMIAEAKSKTQKLKLTEKRDLVAEIKGTGESSEVVDVVAKK